MSVEHVQSRQVRVGRCTDQTTWNSFVEPNGGSPYTSWEWGNAVESYGHDRRYILAHSDGETVAALPLFHMKSRLFGSQLVSPPFAARGTIVTRDGHTDVDEAVSTLTEATAAMADALDVDFVSLRGEDLGNVDRFERKNRFVTFRIPLSEDSSESWESVKESRRRQIEQAADAGLEYEVGTSIEELREYYDLHLESMRGHGTPPHSFQFFRELWDGFYEDGNLHLGLIRRNGSVINAILDLSFGSTVYQWGVVTDYEHRDLNGGSLALWKSLERACEAGFETYEMGRTREGSGVYMFKKSFGGEKIWYDDYHYFPSGEGTLPHPDDETYDQVKRVWRKLPLEFTRIVGPHVRKDVSL